MFEWLKKLFSRKTEPIPAAPEKRMETKPCRTCGKPISFDPSWTHIPNYCPECKAKYRAEHPAQERGRRIRRKCRSCGREFTFPSTVQHWPNYCRDCRAKFKEQKA